MPDTSSDSGAARLPARSEDWLVGGGEMGERTRAFDWSATSVGPVDRWPQSLRSAISILLPSKAQIILFWGPEFVAFYNDAYRPVFGLKHPWALGRPGREVWQEVWETVLRPLFEGVRATGEAFWAANLPFLIERHGYPEETYFDVSYDPVRDESGAVGGIFCIVSETTGRVVGERRLGLLRDLGPVADARSVEEVFTKAAAVLERNAQDIPFALFLDANGAPVAGSHVELRGAWPIDRARPREVLLNAADVHGFGQLPGGPWPEPATHALLLPIGTTGQPASGFLVAGISPRRALDDAYRDFLRLVASNLGAAVAAARVIEEERAQAESLAALDRAKTAFFSNVSHEFRTPLTLMLGPLEEELRANPGAPRLDLAYRSSLRLLKLVNTLLDFSRLEAGRISASYEPTDLAQLTTELASVFRSAIEKGGLQLRVECAPLPEPVYVDREMWEKIVLNLLSNAFKFTFAGEIGVHVEWRGDRVELTVRDTGVGIPEADLPRMFERFYRVKHTRARTHEGTGIGLALVREIARLHGGDVAVDSREGVGTRFVVSIRTGTDHLPVDRLGAARQLASTAVAASAFIEEAQRWLPAADQVPAEEPAEVQNRETAPVDRSRPRVLLADDNADMRGYLRGLLTAEYQVVSAIDGQDALDRLRAEPVDLLITDIMMPRLDGFGLIAAIRADEQLSRLPVIVLSARAGEDSRIEGLAAGADAYLVKPFSARELLVTVASQLQLARQRQEHERSLRAADRRKDEFLAVLAHELRNPLAPIRNAVEILRRSDARDAGTQQLVEIMSRQIGQMVRLIDDLLNVSRISRGQIELRKAPVDLGAVVLQAVETARPELERAGVELTLTLPAEPVILTADQTRLVQAVGNLLNNAAKFTRSPGRVWVTAEQVAREAVIRVRDSGIGIAAEHLHSVFEMFVQVDTSLERKRSGLGLGLTIVKTLVEQHGGVVEARSDGLGTGAEFVIRLPLPRRALPAPAADPKPAVAPASAVRPRRVLIVEDNRDSASMLGQLMTMAGHEVRMTHDGLDGVAAVETFHPDIVLLDLGLPELNGYDAAQRIRSLPSGAKLPIVALTGWGQDADRRRSAECGFDAHLVKPVDPDLLSHIVQDLTAEKPPA